MVFQADNQQLKSQLKTFQSQVQVDMVAIYNNMSAMNTSLKNEISAEIAKENQQRQILQSEVQSINSTVQTMQGKMSIPSLSKYV